MIPAPELPSASSRSRLSLWAVLLVTLGLAVLFGTVAASAWFVSSRAPAPAAGVPTSSPPSSLGPPAAPPPKLPLPSAEPEELPALLPAAVAGPSSGPAESGALLPLSAGQAIWGASDALVTLQLFGDLASPQTRAALGALVRVAAHFEARVRLVYSHGPRGAGDAAFDGAPAIAGLALRSPATAWRALAEAAASAEPAERSALARWFSRAGSESEPELLASVPEARARVEADRLLATLLDVQQTPTLFLNGRRFIGEVSESALESALQNEARAVRWLRAQGVAADEAYARRVRQNLIGVDSGAPSRACVPSDDAPSLGPRDALVTIVEFSDFECAHCRALEATLSRALKRYPGLVRRVWRSFALPQHARAPRLAAFARAARDVSGERAFWAVHAALSSIEDGDFADERLLTVAAKLHLDGERLLAAAEEPERQRALERDRELAESLGLTGAPTLFVNGREVAGAWPAPALEALLKEEIAAAQRVRRASNGVRAAESVLCQ